MTSDPQPGLADEPPDMPPAKRRRLLWGYFARYKRQFMLGALFLLATNALGLAIPAYLGEAIQLMRDGLDQPEGLAAVREEVVEAALIIIGLAIGAGIVRIFSRIFIFNAGRYIEFDVRNELYAKLTRLTPAFFSNSPTGDITSRSANDVNYIRLFYAVSFLHIINTTVAYAIALTRMAQLDWVLTLVCLAPYPIFLFGLRFLIRALFHQTKIVQGQLSGISSKVQENLGGVYVVKSYGLESSEKRLFGEMNHDYYDESMSLAVIRGGMQSIMALMAGIGTLLVLIVGSQAVLDGDMALGAFVEFNAYVVALAFPTMAMGWVFSVWNRGLAGFDRVMAIMEHEPDIEAPPAGQRRYLPPATPGVARGDIRFEHVSFRYPGTDAEVLEDIDLHIRAGSTVAVVGKTGSGKTTLVKLLARLYDPTSGRITIDGEPLDELALRTTRSEIGVVPQDPFLFSMTIGQNVRFGVDALEYDPTISRPPPRRPLIGRHADPDATVDQDERIRQAVEVAGLAGDLDSFSLGLDTLVGERGVTLSGGQKQRVTIARALLVDPRVLVLDDALSSVDTQTEQIILDHLDDIMADRTSIVLTHRFNALARVDRIFVLDEGRLVESGSHAELLERQGHYYKMFERQKLEESLDS